MKEGKIEGYSYKVLMEKDNKLIGRKEIIIEFEGINKPTPSRSQMREFVKKILKIDDDNKFVVKRIRNYFGLPRFFVEVFVYKDEETLKYFEPTYVLKRNQLIQEQQNG